MEPIKEIVIIGGGSSIKEGISLELKDKIKDKLVLGTNYSFLHFVSTALCFVDREFYYPTQDSITKKTHPNIYEELKQLPLIIGINQNGIEEFQLPNTILLKKSESYQREKCIKNGFYRKLTGIFALTLASYLLNYQGVIYLLGFDFSRRDPKTVPIGKNYNPYSEESIHYYSDVQHRGIKWISYYENHNPDNYFKYFLEPNLKIYNVSLESNIQNFKKINYKEFFKLLSSEQYNQEELRIYIKNKLGGNDV